MESDAEAAFRAELRQALLDPAGTPQLLAAACLIEYVRAGHRPFGKMVSNDTPLLAAIPVGGEADPLAWLVVDTTSGTGRFEAYGAEDEATARVFELSPARPEAS